MSKIHSLWSSSESLCGWRHHAWNESVG